MRMPGKGTRKRKPSSTKGGKPSAFQQRLQVLRELTGTTALSSRSGAAQALYFRWGLSKAKALEMEIARLRQERPGLSLKAAKELAVHNLVTY